MRLSVLLFGSLLELVSIESLNPRMEGWTNSITFA